MHKLSFLRQSHHKSERQKMQINSRQVDFMLVIVRTTYVLFCSVSVWCVWVGWDKRGTVTCWS